MRRTAALPMAVSHGRRGEDPEVRGQVGEVLRRARLLHRVGALPERDEGADPTSLPIALPRVPPGQEPGDQRALRKFNRVARANEVLTDDEQRKKLDYYTENPSEYWSLYGTFVDFSYAPKTSLKGVLFILLVFAALVQPAFQYSKYQEYTKALVKAALARAPEGAAFRKEADEIVAEESKKRKKGKKTKMTSQEEKAFLKETLQKLVAKSELPDEYAFPSLRDNLFVKVALYPLSMFKSNARSSELKKKIASGQVLDADEAQEVIEGYLGGADAWDALSGSEQHKLLLSTKCYLKENFDKWQSTRQEAASPMKASTKREIRQRKKGAPAFVMDGRDDRRHYCEKRSGSQVKKQEKLAVIFFVASTASTTASRKIVSRHPHRRRPRRPRPAARPCSHLGMDPSGGGALASSSCISARITASRNSRDAGVISPSSILRYVTNWLLAGKYDTSILSRPAFDAASSHSSMAATPP